METEIEDMTKDELLIFKQNVTDEIRLLRRERGMLKKRLEAEISSLDGRLEGLGALSSEASNRLMYVFEVDL